MKKKYMITAAVLGISTLLAGCGSGSTGSGTLKVGVRDDIVNFGYLNPDTQQYYGFEIDLARQMAEKMGYADVEYVTVTTDTREQLLESGEVDCLVAAYSISDERKEKFDFSPSYYEDLSGIVVEKSSLIEDFSGLVGAKIGGLTGANTSDALKAKMIEAGLITEDDYRGTTYETFDSYTELDTQLEEGNVDAICMDGCIANAYMDDNNSFLNDVIGSTEYGVATLKGSDLSAKVADTIQGMLDDGTVDTIKDKWD